MNIQSLRGERQTRNTDAPLRVCFVALFTYSLFNRATSFTFGGSEVRTWLLAKTLAEDPRFQVSVLVRDHGQPDGEVFDNVTMIKSRLHVSAEKVDNPIASPKPGPKKAPSLGLRIIRSLTHRSKRLFGMEAGNARSVTSLLTEETLSVYGSIEADVFCVPGVHELAATVVSVAKSTGRQSVLMASSDLNFSSTYIRGSEVPDPYGSRGGHCFHAINTADTILVQTERQKKYCLERFGRESNLLSNPIDLNGGVPCLPRTDREGYVLWVGKSDNTKRPWMFVELARQFPEQKFKMVMNKITEDIHDQCIRDQPSNLEIIERVPFLEIDTLFANASAFVSTSRFEGFPNTFLQAAKYGVPILSLVVDPDQMLETHNAGVMLNDDDGDLLAGLRRIIDSDKAWEAFAQAGRDYVLAHNDLNMISDDLAETLLSTNEKFNASHG